LSKKTGEAMAREHAEEPQEEEKKTKKKKKKELILQTAEFSFVFWLFTLVVNENMYSYEMVKSLNSSTNLSRNV
jgi:hypothetical protein